MKKHHIAILVVGAAAVGAFLWVRRRPGGVKSAIAALGANGTVHGSSLSAAEADELGALS